LEISFSVSAERRLSSTISEEAKIPQYATSSATDRQ
jgi:hypothetical protein